MKTPKWELEFSDGLLVKEGEKTVAVIHAGSEDDALLICAAPELLSWMQAVIRQLEYEEKLENRSGGSLGMIPMLKAVVEKALGSK